MNLSHCLPALACLSLLLSPPAAAAQAPEQAAAAGSFTDSVGINVHWGYGGSRYADSYPQVKRLLIESGIRHVRGDLNRAQDLAASGIHTMAVADIPTYYTQFPAFTPVDGDSGAIRDVPAEIKKNNAPLRAIDSVEGPGPGQVRPAPLLRVFRAWHPAHVLV